MNKFMDILNDRRLLQYCIPNLVRSSLLKKNIKKVEVDKIFVTSTFDVEYHVESGGFYPLEEFFKNKKFSENSTFFVQGNLVEKYQKELKKSKAEIGLHGYAHELWGPKRWWISKPFVGIHERELLLNKSLQNCKNCKIKKPVSFRAPYLLADNYTYSLLKKYDFNMDSSLPSFLGIYPVPQKINNIFSIPVSSNPVPKFSFRNGIPYTYYDILTMEIMKFFSKGNFIDFVNTVFYFQNLFSIKPNLVLLSHPWEFVKIQKHGFEYCSPSNYNVIEKLFSILKENYSVKHVTISELGELLRA